MKLTKSRRTSYPSTYSRICYPVVADRAIALVFQLAIRPGCEPHAIALGGLDAGAKLVFIRVEQPNRAIVEVGRAVRKLSGVC